MLKNKGGRNIGADGRFLKTHGLTKHRFYETWNSMLQRCNNSNDTSYSNYGGRGITVCNEWLDARTFIDWCETQNPVPPGYSLDRTDVNGNYEPSNCRFVSKSVQQRNRRDAHKIVYRNKLISFADLVDYGEQVTLKVAEKRLKLGWSYYEAAFIPSGISREIYFDEHPSRIFV